MATTTARRIATIALAAAICLTFMAVSLLLNPLAEGLAPAAENLPAWGGYGGLPPMW
jgi:hypothetical protein